VPQNATVCALTVLGGKDPDATQNSIQGLVSLLPVTLSLWLFLNYLSPPAGFDIPENTSVVCIAQGLESTEQACVQSRLVYSLHENAFYLCLRR